MSEWTTIWPFWRKPRDSASAGTVELIRGFTTADRTISQDLTVEGEAWKLEADQSRVVKLFEVASPEAAVDDCLVTYRAKLRSANLNGQAFLEMWCRLPAKGEFFSRGLLQTMSGTTEWASYETPFRLKKGQRPDLIKLNLVVEGQGTVWIRDIELLKTAR